MKTKMKSLPLFIVLLVLGNYVRGAAANHGARVDIFAPRSELRYAPQNGLKISFGTWQRPENVRRYLTVELPPAREWRNGSIVFTAVEGGQIKITLLGPCIPGGRTTDLKLLGVYYDNIKVNGKLVANGDFEAGQTGFNFWCRDKDKPYRGRIVEDPEIARNGNCCALAWHNGHVSFGIKTKPGETVTLTFDYCAAQEIPKLEPDFSTVPQ